MNYEQRILEIYNEYLNLQTNENVDVRNQATEHELVFLGDLERLIEDNNSIIENLKLSAHYD